MPDQASNNVLGIGFSFYSAILISRVLMSSSALKAYILSASAADKGLPSWYFLQSTRIKSVGPDSSL